jgi:mRNA interferase YafQ
MRTIERTAKFKRDYKREAKGPHAATLRKDFIHILSALATDAALAPRYRVNRRVARPSRLSRQAGLVLIYRKPNDTSLQLVRLGSHSELSLSPGFPSPSALP